MMSFISIFIAIGGVLLTIILGAIFPGRRRWAVLLSLPALTLGLTYLSLFISGRVLNEDGNLLAVAVYGVLLVGLFVYYPLLFVVALIAYIRARKREKI